MPDEVVEIGAFAEEASAWIARATLEANGIRSEVVPMLQARGYPFAVRARLAVRAEDAAAAMKILQQASEGP